MTQGSLCSDAVEHIVEKLSVIDATRRAIWLGDYIELLANLVVLPEEVMPFMGCLCLLTKSVEQKSPNDH